MPMPQSTRPPSTMARLRKRAPKRLAKTHAEYAQREGDKACRQAMGQISAPMADRPTPTASASTLVATDRAEQARLPGRGRLLFAAAATLRNHLTADEAKQRKGNPMVHRLQIGADRRTCQIPE